jgi:hypothetical protein
MDQLHAIAPAAERAEEITVTSRQRDPKDSKRYVENKITHVIEPFTYRKLFKVLGHFNRIFASLQSLGALDFNDPISLLRVVTHASEHAGDDVQALVCLAIDRPVEYLDTLDPEDGLKLTIKVAKVQKDFFVERILPMLTDLRAEVESVQKEVGATL